MTEQMHDPVTHPAGYTSHPSGIEIINLARTLPLAVGSAVQYVMRRDYKGSAYEDLSKAIWYLEDSIHNGPAYYITRSMKRVAAEIIAAEPNPTVISFLRALTVSNRDGFFGSSPDLELARDLVVALREEYI